MKFTQAKFFGLYVDGLVHLDGYAFDVAGRLLIAHKERPETRAVNPGYLVSERTSGFRVPIKRANTRAVAATYAVEQMKKVDDTQWAAAIAYAMNQRAAFAKKA